MDVQTQVFMLNDRDLCGPHKLLLYNKKCLGVTICYNTIIHCSRGIEIEVHYHRHRLSLSCALIVFYFTSYMSKSDDAFIYIHINIPSIISFMLYRIMHCKARQSSGNPMVMSARDHWRHFDTASWTVPTYEKNPHKRVKEMGQVRQRT